VSKTERPRSLQLTAGEDLNRNAEPVPKGGINYNEVCHGLLPLLEEGRAKETSKKASSFGCGKVTIGGAKRTGSKNL
jgi:hypothetical protein